MFTAHDTRTVSRYKATSERDTYYTGFFFRTQQEQIFICPRLFYAFSPTPHPNPGPRIVITVSEVYPFSACAGFRFNEISYITIFYTTRIAESEDPSD